MVFWNLSGEFGMSKNGTENIWYCRRLGGEKPLPLGGSVSDFQSRCVDDFLSPWLTHCLFNPSALGLDYQVSQDGIEDKNHGSDDNVTIKDVE